MRSGFGRSVFLTSLGGVGDAAGSGPPPPLTFCDSDELILMSFSDVQVDGAKLPPDLLKTLQIPGDNYGHS